MRKWMLLTAAILTLMFAPVKADITTPTVKERFEPIKSVYDKMELQRYFLEHPAPSLVEVQLRLVDPKARTKNGNELLAQMRSYNEATTKWRDEFATYKTIYDVRPEVLLPFIQEMKDRLDRLEQILHRYDEVQ